MHWHYSSRCKWCRVSYDIDAFPSEKRTYYSTSACPKSKLLCCWQSYLASSSRHIWAHQQNTSGTNVILWNILDDASLAIYAKLTAQFIYWSVIIIQKVACLILAHSLYTLFLSLSLLVTIKQNESDASVVILQGWSREKPNLSQWEGAFDRRQLSFNHLPRHSIISPRDNHLLRPWFEVIICFFTYLP